MAEKTIYYIFLINSISTLSIHSTKCVSPKLGMFDCGDGECVSNDVVCDGKVDCPNSTSKDELDCEHHFRRRCLSNHDDVILNVENLTNFYIGYNLVSGLSRPLLDWRHLDTAVDHESDCRRAVTESDDVAHFRQSLPFLPYNVASFTYHDDDEKKRLQFQSAAFNSSYDAFLDLKKRKSIVVGSNLTYDDLRTVTLSDAYRVTAFSSETSPPSYWIDEGSFWQQNSPFVRFYLEKITGEFRLRPIYRLALNPEFVADFVNAIRRGNDSDDEKEIWRELFDRYGTHFPIGGTVGGSIEIIVKRKNCSKKQDHHGAHHTNVSMADIQKCVLAKIHGNNEEEKWLCGRLEKKLNVHNVSDAIDWTYRKVIGGDWTMLGSIDHLPISSHLDQWARSVSADERSLSTELMALCELVERFALEYRNNETGGGVGRENEAKISKSSPCNKVLLDYVIENDVLHVPKGNLTLIPCRKDAVRVWRLVNKKFVLRGLPWCLSTTNVEESCPAAAAALTAGNETVANAGMGQGKWGKEIFLVGAMIISMTGSFGRWGNGVLT